MKTTLTNHGAAIALPEPDPGKDFNDIFSGTVAPPDPAITDPDWRWNPFAPIAPKPTMKIPTCEDCAFCGERKGDSVNCAAFMELVDCGTAPECGSFTECENSINPGDPSSCHAPHGCACRFAKVYATIGDPIHREAWLGEGGETVMREVER